MLWSWPRRRLLLLLRTRLPLVRARERWPYRPGRCLLQHPCLATATSLVLLMLLQLVVVVRPWLLLVLLVPPPRRGGCW